MATPSNQRLLISEKPYNAGTPLSALLDELTPNEMIFVRNHFEVPEIDADGWSLTVDGTVTSPRSISYPELQTLPVDTLTAAFECAGNGRKLMDPQPEGTPWAYEAVSIVRFTGTALANVLNVAGIASDTAEVVFQGADQGEVEPGRNEHYVRSLPLDLALNRDILLAWEMNGKRLTAQHGFPVRLVVPGWYGMASVKWLRRITLVNKPHKSYFQNEHYMYLDEAGSEKVEPVRQIRTRSLILSPGDGARLANDEVEVRGIAWSGYGAIAHVELSTDGGSHWSKTTLEPPSSRHGVQRWRQLWRPGASGKYQLRCRATDAAGNSQPDSQRWNKLGYGNNGPHSISVDVRSEL